jgi:hypothetical protein
MIKDDRFLEDLQEGIGTLDAVEEHDGFTLARFKGFGLILPPELGPQLSENVGFRVGILKIDGTYRLRIDRRQ